MKNKKLIIGLSLLVIAGIGTGYYFYRKQNKEVKIGSEESNAVLKDMKMY